MDDDRVDFLKSELARLVDIAIRVYEPEIIILFGSMANEDKVVTEWSDIDLFIVKDTKKTYYERLHELDELLDRRVDMDLIVMDKEEFEEVKINNEALKKEILGKGKILYERSISLGWCSIEWF